MVEVCHRSLSIEEGNIMVEVCHCALSIEEGNIIVEVCHRSLSIEEGNIMVEVCHRSLSIEEGIELTYFLFYLDRIWTHIVDTLQHQSLNLMSNALDVA